MSQLEDEIIIDADDGAVYEADIDKAWYELSRHSINAESEDSIMEVVGAKGVEEARSEFVELTFQQVLDHIESHPLKSMEWWEIFRVA